ncbi:hypothetical protein V2J09_024344 [Rumex salicifolius]
MQQQPSVMPVMSSFPPTNITTEQIQKYLDENKKLILAILDNQNLGKLAECAQYQTQLQKNLMYLAAIADAQPQMPAMPSPMAGGGGASPHPGMQQGGAAAYYMHPQGAGMAQQQQQQQQQQAGHGHSGFSPSPKMHMQYGASPHQLHQQQQQQQLHQQAAMQGQMNVRPGGPGNGMHQMMHSEASMNRQSSTGPETDVSGSSAGGNGDKDSSYAKGADDAKCFSSLIYDHIT